MINTFIHRFESKKPGRKVAAVYEFDKKLYLVEAPKTDNDMNGSFFLSDKNAENVFGFSPTCNLNKFKEVIQVGPLYKRR